MEAGARCDRHRFRLSGYAPAVMAKVGSSVPRIGMTGAWTNPQSTEFDSGRSFHLAQALTLLGVYGGYREAFPFTPVARLIRLWRRAIGRSTSISALMLTP